MIPGTEKVMIRKINYGDMKHNKIYTCCSISRFGGILRIDIEVLQANGLKKRRNV